MPAKSELRLAIEEVLADGEWHDREEIVGLTWFVVEPMLALRLHERLLRYQQTHRERHDPGQPVRRKSEDMRQSLRVAARVRVNQVLRTAVLNGSFVKEGDQFRLPDSNGATDQTGW